ncbi:MAG TPA: YfcC family protein, partial [Casimicrobiaceae bacterium]|nr:YfcC family protein [Casimicrobiaceae bacterium]
MRLRFPHPLPLLVGFIALATVMTYVLPAGQFDRRDDPATGRKVVVAGTYHAVPQAPVTPFQAVVAIPKGLLAAGPVIFLVFLIGGAFGVVDQTGALHRGVAWMVQRLERREMLVIPIVCLAFGTAGALDNMHEEIIPLVPVLLLLTTRLGFDNVVAAAVSVGAADVGSAFSPINPFQVGIAQKLAGLPLLSGSGFRMVFLALALGLWIAGVSRYARATRTARVSQPSEEQKPLDIRDGLVLITILMTFTIFIVGVMEY